MKPQLSVPKFSTLSWTGDNYYSPDILTLKGRDTQV